MVGRNSAVLLPQRPVAQALEIDTWLLALLLFAWLVIGDVAINRIVMAFVS